MVYYSMKEYFSVKQVILFGNALLANIGDTRSFRQWFVMNQTIQYFDNDIQLFYKWDLASSMLQFLVLEKYK